MNGLSLILGLGEALQLRHQNDADQRSGETAVVQAEATMEIGHRSHQQVVQHRCQETVTPAVLVGDGADRWHSTDPPQWPGRWQPA